jgi:hypothetical protein
MHRSGTSCLTGSLQEAGLFLDEIHTWNPHNLKGNRENQKFVDLHDDILAANGGAWDNPPKKITWSASHVETARALIAEHAGQPVFGFKDPRVLLLLDGWRDILPDMEFVGIYRHPNAVASSLQKRSGKPWEESLELWHVYNNRMYQLYRRKSFPILCFDDHEAILDEKMFAVARQLGLNGGPGEEKFYSSELRSTNESEATPMPWKVRRLYKKLRKVGL